MAKVGGGGEFKVLEGKRMPEVFQTFKEWSTLQKNNLRSRARTCTCCSYFFISVNFYFSIVLEYGNVW